MNPQALVCQILPMQITKSIKKEYRVKIEISDFINLFFFFLLISLVLVKTDTLLFLKLPDNANQAMKERQAWNG